MKPRAVIVDVAVDQGGCIETTRETTHDDPVYEAARRGALRRRQHARRGAAHEHVRPHQRDAALHPGRRRARAGGGGASAIRRWRSASTPSPARSPTSRSPSSSASTTSIRWLPSPADPTPRIVRPWGQRVCSTSRCRRSRSSSGDTTFDIMAERLAAAETSWIARNPFGFSILHYDDVVAMLRDKRWHSATGRIMELQGRHRPAVPRSPADVDPVGGGRRAHPAAPARRAGVLAASRRSAAAVHARGHRRPRRRRRARRPRATSPSTSASRTRSRSSASCSARRRRTGSCSAAGPPTCCASSTATSHDDLPTIVAAQDELDEYVRGADRRAPDEAGRRPAHRPDRGRGGGRPARRPTSW